MKRILFISLTLFMLSVPVNAENIIHPSAIRASSTLYDGIGDYSPWYTQDNNLNTAWVEGAAGTGIGEYLAFDVPAGTTVSGLFLSPGYLKSEDIFYKNAAPTKLLVYSGLQSAMVDCSYMAQTYFANSDANWGSFYFDHPVVSDGTVYVEIRETRDGWKFSDTCINELQLLGEEAYTSSYSNDSSGFNNNSSYDNSASVYDLPDTFIFASGVGGWSTEMSFFDNWYFKGKFQDSDRGDTGYGYPNGTIYESNFSGFLTELGRISSYAVKFELYSMIHSPKENEERFEDGVRYVGSTPYGLYGGDEFILYYPGTPTSELTEDCINWIRMFLNYEVPSALPDGFYVFYNVKEGNAFVGKK